MALADTVRRRSPPPLPVKFRLDAQPWSLIDKETVLLLRNLTNHEIRGDFKDNGNGAGSLFRHLIDDVNDGTEPVEGWWAIVAWPEGSRFSGPIAWCLLRPERRHLPGPTVNLGTYVRHDWRRRGLGRALANEATRLAHLLGFKHIVASPWNKRSEAFFKGLCCNITCQYTPGMAGTAEFNVPEHRPARLPWRCRPPEIT